MNHLGESELSALLDGALEPQVRAAAERHLAACPECRDALAELEARDSALAAALARDPGDDYFDTFAARVEERIRAGGAEKARAELPRTVPGRAIGSTGPASVFDSIGRWLSGPRLAWIGAAAAVVVGVGVVLVVSHETPVQTLRDSGLAARTDQVAGGGSPSAAHPSDERPPAGGPSTERPPAVRPPAAGPSAAARPSEAFAMKPEAAARSEQAVPSAGGAPPPAAKAAVEGAAGPGAAAERSPATPSGSAVTNSETERQAVPPSRMREVRNVGGEATPVPSPANTLAP